MNESKRKRMMYSKEALKLAIKAVESGLPINAASVKYQIPRSTLHSKVNGLYEDKKPGPSSVLPPSQESQLVEWIFECSRRGHAVTKMQLLNSVRIIVKETGLQAPFGANGPGKSWYSCFVKRHKDVCTQMTENMSQSKAAVSEVALKKWYSTVGAHLEVKGLIDIDSTRIFNTDETALQLNPTSDKVWTRRGSNNVYSIVNSNEKEALTILVTGNAAGQLAPPLIMFSYKRIPKKMYEKCPSGWSYGTSDSGWMQGENFYEYITNVFHPWLIKTDITLPVILYVDGHASYLTQPLAKFCYENQIELIALHPNSTQIIQPIDQSMFHPLKVAWKKHVSEYCQRNNCLSVLKIDAAQELEQVFNNLDLKRILSNGFEACGLKPFSSNAINYSVFQSNEQLNDQSSVQTSYPDYFVALKCIEESINPTTLTAFRAASDENEWTGRTEDTSLFHIWNNMSKRVKVYGIEQGSSTMESREEDIKNPWLA
ncbi:uncharacterized protein LOC143355123 [Halictus rubicundus]|uniref:uncharacterized protein LOC143355123 n=1 Tax=Halictus rubicundus TaxID=77578 RepID=UPI0040353FFD